MLNSNQLTHQILSHLKISVLITCSTCILLLQTELVYSSESNLASIHKMQDIRIKDRELSSQEIQNKINTYKKLSKELKDNRETKKQLIAEKFRLLDALIFGQDFMKATLAQRTNIMRINLDIIHQFIKQDYPVEKFARLKAVKNLQNKLENNPLSLSLMEEFYNILHNEIEISQKDQVRTETITIFNEEIEAVTFNIGRIGYYFINEDKKLTGLFSPNLKKWKLVDFEIYADRFNEAIDTIENTLSERYIILPVEVLSKANVK